jgi:hypothetical protein
MDKLEVMVYDELIDLLHEKISEGNYHEAKKIADCINSRSTKSRKRDPSFATA